MQIQEYVQKQDSLASEDILYEIPVRKEYILTQLGRGKRILDVGCSGGQISQLIMSQNNEVWGVELNPDAAHAAEKRGIRVKVANVEEGLPFESGFFDAVNAGEVLEHLYDTKFFFEEVRRVLKKDGVFIFTTPNLNSLENRLRVLMGGYLAMTGAYPEDHFGQHIRIFNRAKIDELCRESGFVLEDIRGIHTLRPHGWADLPLRWAGRLVPSFSKLLIVKARKTG